MTPLCASWILGPRWLVPAGAPKLIRRTTSAVATVAALAISVALLGGAVRPSVQVSNIGNSPRFLMHQAQARPLPPEQYALLRAQALVNARFVVGPKLKNPFVQENGLNPSILRALHRQRQYFDAWAMHSRYGKQLAGAPADDSGGDEKPGNPEPQLLTRAEFPQRNSLCRLPGIRTVNGKASGAVFTPQARNNVYRVEGCSFGNIRGQLQLEPHPTLAGLSAVPIPLKVDDSANAWSDTAIIARLDPQLAGVFDSPVTLVIYPGNGRRLEMPGCVFVAARIGPQLLGMVPSTWVTLQPSTTHARHIQELEYVSPPSKGSSAPNDAAANSLFVARYDSEDFAAGSDTLHLGRLSPGWVVDSIQLQTYSIPCPGDVIHAGAKGRWNVRWSLSSFAVSWQESSCQSFIPPSFRFDMNVSQYAVRIWVSGPVGTEPFRSPVR